jgi:hypothetical protein
LKWYALDSLAPVILAIGIACGVVQLLAAAYAANEEHAELATTEGLLTLVWLSIPALITLRWAWGLRDDDLVAPRVPGTWVAATGVQLVGYLAFSPGNPFREALPAVLIVALVFLWAVWSGRLR